MIRKYLFVCLLFIGITLVVVGVDKSVQYVQNYFVQITLKKIRTLNLESSSQQGQPLHISAASGLVADDENFYVIADDELSLAKFPSNGSAGTLVPIFPGSLPLDPKERKKLKPDFESLVSLDGGLLAVPSGSKKNRVNGAYIKNNLAVPVDFSKIYPALEEKIPDLNIEGSVVYKDQLLLFQRGNGSSGINAVIMLNLAAVQNAIKEKVAIPSSALLEIKTISLGFLKNVRLGFTDATVDKNNNIWFLAAAEGSDSTYLDGQYLGAVIGRLDPEFNPISVREINCPQKPEGLAFTPDGLKLFIVTDADDTKQSSVLFEVVGF